MEVHKFLLVGKPTKTHIDQFYKGAIKAHPEENAVSKTPRRVRGEGYLFDSIATAFQS